METKNKHTITILIIITIAILAVAGIIFASQNPASFSKNQTQESAFTTPYHTPEPQKPRATMQFIPQTVTTTIGKPVTFNLEVNAYGAVINGLDAVLSYDPAKITIESIDNNSSSDNQSLTVVRKLIQDNKVIITAVKSNADTIPTNIYVPVSITLRPLTAGTHSLSFLLTPGTAQDSTVIRAQDNQNILDTVQNASLYVQ